MKGTLIILFVCFCFSNSSPSTWEEIFLQIPNEAYAYEHLSYYTSMPHVAGTIEDYDTAEYTLKKFQEYGLKNSEIWAFEALVTWPKNRTLEMVEPYHFAASLKEDEVPVDPTTYDPRITPTFNGYAPSGDVTAELVYVNYGTYEDFQTLKSMGVPLEGKIAIARYGYIFRGTKVMIAELFGMKGMIIYSDPADDGYGQGTVFPEGPWRPSSGVQRGSVQFISLCPGDPRRTICSNDPNYNYTDSLPKIPVQPISWSDAYPLLKSLSGTPAPKDWQGGLNFTYNIGPGPTVVHLALESDFEVKTLWNVIAKIDGVDTEKTLLMGNHRDAWVFGATDPNSGTAVLLEVARSFGQMLQQGWKPQRNIWLCSWDGEEYALLGSTAFVEANGDFLLKNAMAYLNIDVGISGSQFFSGATPSLANVVRKASTMVTDPKSGKPISDVWDQQQSVLGSGSDFTAILDHFGVPSTDFGFGGIGAGVYHSIYDDIHWMNNFGDPGYHYHKACAQMWGLTAIEFVDAVVLPYNYTEYGTSLESFYNSILSLLKQHGGNLDLSNLRNSIVSFQQAANTVGEEIVNANKFSDDQLKVLNDRLMLTERQFLSKEGLPKRPYYKHVVQAPGLYEGYAADVFPGLAQAIRDEDWNQALEQAQIISSHIEQAALFLTGN